MKVHFEKELVWTHVDSLEEDPVTVSAPNFSFEPHPAQETVIAQPSVTVEESATLLSSQGSSATSILSLEELAPGPLDIPWMERENFYNSFNRGVVNVSGDGHCYQNALELALLCDHGLVVSANFINHAVFTELEENKALFVNYHTPKDTHGNPVVFFSQEDKEADMIHQALQYLAQKQYRRDIVDVLIVVAAKALKISIGTFIETQQGLHLIEAGVPSTKTRIYLQLNREHYMAVIKKDHQPPTTFQQGSPSLKYVQQNIPLAASEEASVDVLAPPPPPYTEPTDNSQRSSRMKFPLKLYGGLKPVPVKQVPQDINGFCSYKIQVPAGEDWLKLEKDSRHFEMTSSRPCKEEVGTVIQKVGWCAGSFYCPNEDCGFSSQSGSENTSHWESKKDLPGRKFCFTCGYEGKHKPCRGRKMTRYNRITRELIIFHINRHTCTLKMRSRERDEYFREVISQNPGLSVGELQVHHVNQAMMRNDIATAVQRSSLMADTSRLRNIQKQMKRAGAAACGVGGQSIQAMLDHQKSVEEHDKYLLFEFNLQGMQRNLPEYAFKTCKASLQLALHMDAKNPMTNSMVINGRSVENPMCSEYAFFDGQHSRVKGFITLALYTTMAAAKKLVTLARCEVRTESSQTVGLFFYLFNKALRDYTEDNTTSFNPCCIITDMAGAIQNGIQQACGYTFWKEKVKGCQQHYFKNMGEHAAPLPEPDRTMFLKLSSALVRATNPMQYDKVYSALGVIAKKYPGLEGKVKWWHKRKYMNSDIFREMESRKTNLAESGHSSYSTKGGPMWLVKACQLDASKLLLQTSHIHAFLQGRYHSTGRGPTQLARRMKDMEEQKRAVKEFDCVLESIQQSISTGKKHPLDYSSGEDQDEEDCHYMPAAREPFKAKGTLKKVKKSQPPKPSVPDMMQKSQKNIKKKLLLCDMLEKHHEVDFFMKQVEESEKKKKEEEVKQVNELTRASELQKWARNICEEENDADEYAADEADAELDSLLIHLEAEEAQQKEPAKKKRKPPAKKSKEVPSVGTIKEKGRMPQAGAFSHLTKGNVSRLTAENLGVPIQQNSPFVIYLNHAQIKRCQGCRVPIKNPAKTPENLIVRMLGHRPFNTPQGYRDKIGPCYFHVDIQCLKNFDARIEMSDCTMEVEDYMKLDRGHLAVLGQAGFLQHIKDSIITLQ